MKLEARQVAHFLRDPSPCRVVLLHGDDAGLIRERANTLVRLVAGSLDDPFRVAELDREAHGRLEDEASALSMTGGRRVVCVRDAVDGLVAAVKAVLAGRSEALIVLEAPTLTAKSRLRTLLESAPNAVSLGCYPETGAALAATIRTGLSALRVGLEPDAAAWLADHLGSDRGVTQREIEKLASFAGPGGTIDLEAAQLSTGDHAALSLEDALHAATAGETVLADRALDRAFAEGATSVGVLRAALSHVQRLHRMRLGMRRGWSATEAVRSARPPVFFRRVPPTVRALETWSAPRLLAAAEELQRAELACKQTGAPGDAICRALITRLARSEVGRKRPVD